MKGASEVDRALELLARYESRNVTFMEEGGSWPVVWERARGMYVWDTNGKRYLDLTAAFGVANAGHANPQVVRAGQKQMAKLLHAMGDVHPHPLKGDLVQRLSQITFERWSDGKIEGRTILNNSGFEAVEAALKTAVLATGKSGVITFTGAYHGLGYGALNATHRSYFRKPFESQLRKFGRAVTWPESNLDKTDIEIRKLIATKRFGAILVEPIQARGGIRVPAPGFLRRLRQLCDRFGLLLILDEIYTGFGRTGAWFACEHERVIPDIICLGKAMSGGFPISACVGRSDLMDRAWPRSHGEALHTSTFLGHPVGCAMALAQIDEITKQIEPAKIKGLFLKDLFPEMRGLGLMAGIELPTGAAAMKAVKRLLHEGYIFLPEGDEGNVIGYTPPLIISEKQIRQSVAALREAIA